MTKTKRIASASNIDLRAISTVRLLAALLLGGSLMVMVRLVPRIG